MTTTAPLRSPQELYLDWERSHWAAQDVDLARDVEQWRALGETERGLGALTRRLKLIGVAL